MKTQAEKMMNAINRKHSNGTGAYHKVNHFCPNFIITNGILDYLQTAECFYMSDKLATEMFETLKTKTPDKYYLTCTVTEPKGEMVLTVKDYNGRVMWTGGYERSTHVPGEVKTYIGWDGDYMIWCLPSED